MAKFSTASLLIGGTIGAIGALLLAPHNGKENRARVAEVVGDVWGQVPEGPRQKAEHLGNQAQQRLNKVSEQARERIDAVGEQAKDVAEQVRQKANDFVDSGRNAEREATRAKIDEAREKIAAQVKKNAEEAKAVLDNKTDIPSVLHTDAQEIKGDLHAAAVAAQPGVVAQPGVMPVGEAMPQVSPLQMQQNAAVATGVQVVPDMAAAPSANPMAAGAPIDNLILGADPQVSSESPFNANPADPYTINTGTVAPQGANPGVNPAAGNVPPGVSEA
ncbi:MAG: hypothetical protein LBL67_03145 [Coriobacteriales bacterium]|nr:hypothetical protein [Coriobacteriales bacterium]